MYQKQKTNGTAKKITVRFEQHKKQNIRIAAERCGDAV